MYQYGVFDAVWPEGYPFFMNRIACPYCDSDIETRNPERFQSCPACGYSSARIDSGPSCCLIIDSQLPDLIDRYEELQGGENGRHILINRRVAHAAFAGTDRRR
jgi:hypothetical protein